MARRVFVALTVAAMMTGLLATGPIAIGSARPTRVSAAAPEAAAPIKPLTLFGNKIMGLSAIVTGPDGNLWFTSQYNGGIGRVTPAGVVTLHQDPKIQRPASIAAGPDGNLWFTGDGTVGRITTNGVVTVFSGGAIKTPSSIVAGPDGNLWYLDVGSAGQLARITPDGVVTTFATGRYPWGLTVGPDGNLWLTTDSNTITRVTPSGVADTFHSFWPALAPNTPGYPISGPDGNIWFVNAGDQTIGRITTSGQFLARIALPGSLSLTGLVKGSDGSAWFTSRSTSFSGVVTATVGKITADGSVSTFNHPGLVLPLSPTTGPDGNIWFGDIQRNAVSRVTPAGVVTQMTADAPQTVRHLTVLDGDVWFDAGGSIGRVTSDGTITTMFDRYIGALNDLVAGPDGNVWFTMSDGRKVASISPTGHVSTYIGPDLYAPGPIVVGADGNLWFADTGGTTIGRVVPGGAITPFTGPGVVQPYGLTPAPDGSLWFFNSTGALKRITTDGTISAIENPALFGTSEFVAGPDGNMWFAMRNRNLLGYVTPAGAVTTFGGIGVDGPMELMVGPDDNLWFLNLGSSSIGRITPTGVVSVVRDPAIAYSDMAAGADGNLWFGSGPQVVRMGTDGLPGPPTAVIAARGDGQVTVGWGVPASDGGSPVTGYTVTATPGGATCTWVAGPLSCTVTGLTNGVAYRFTVAAANSMGATSSLRTNPISPAALPGPPTAVTALPGKSMATVSWSAPATGTGFTAYTATASPGGATCTWTSGPLSCSISGLAAGVPHTIAVTATNAVGTGPAGTSGAVTPWDGAGYHAVDPTRILDSRTATGAWSGALVAGAPRDLQVTGLGGASNVPANATAVVLNVTATGASDGSFLTVHPSGSATPNASNLNFGAGETIANLVTVKVGPGGLVRLANAVGSTHVIADVVGWYDDGVGPGDLFTGTAPTRLLDSRGPTGGWSGPLVAGTPNELEVRQPGNPAGVPPTATAVIANVTVTGGSAGSFLSAWPAGVVQPNVSNLNFAAGQTIPNLAILKIGANGKIAFANAVGSVEVIVDVVGYFDPSGGSRFHAIEPTRILDDRVATGLSGPWGPGQIRAVPVAGAAGTNVAVGATGLVANVTATGGTEGSFLTVFPDGIDAPTSSNVNFGIGQTIPNLVTTKLGANGKIAIRNHLGTVDVIADAVGYYAET